MSSNILENSDSDEISVYDAWVKRVIDPRPLTDHEKTIVGACGMLSAMREKIEDPRMPLSMAIARAQTISEKVKVDCTNGCMCGGLGY